MSELPAGIDPNDLMRDPAKRANHWWHPQTDTVFSMAPDFLPPYLTGRATTVVSQVIDTAGPEDMPEPFAVAVGDFVLGARVASLRTGNHGTITNNDDFPNIDVLVDGSGDTVSTSTYSVRFLSDEEIAADEAAAGITATVTEPAKPAARRSAKPVVETPVTQLPDASETASETASVDPATDSTTPAE